jgi:hypothetical protein
MELPKLQKPDRYVGLYIFDFGGQVSVGFTAQEIAELLDSEKYKNGKVYKIYRALPDGKLELRGVQAQTFQLETGMFFYSGDIDTAKSNFNQLVRLAVKTAPPARAKIHLAKYSDNELVVAIIYPAEYNDDFSRWLIDGQYQTSGAAEGGIEATQRYYDRQPKILDRHQLFGQSELISRTGGELLANLKTAVQR